MDEQEHSSFGSSLIGGIVRAGLTVIKFIAKVSIPLVIGLLVCILFLGGVYVWFNEDRGSNFDITLDADDNNPSVQNQYGGYQAVAITEPQAILDAYYKYMACQSYTKDYNGKTFNFRKNTADFAGLTDYYDAEADFYLAPEFIMMADEVLHDGFHYPEQIIKPVFHEINGGVIKAKLPLTNGNLVDKDAIKNSGFGSILEYKPMEKDKYVNAVITQFQVDYDIQTKHVSEDAEGKRVVWYTVGHREVKTYYTENRSYTDVLLERKNYEKDIKDTLSDGDLTGDGQQTLLIHGPSDGEFKGFFGIETFTQPAKNGTNSFYISHMPQYTEAKDSEIDATCFDDGTLNGAFGNNGDGLYPINIALVDSAATFSGNIKYSYVMDQTEEELQDGGSDQMADPVKEYTYASQCCLPTIHTLRAEKKGSLITVSPVMESRTPEPTNVDGTREADNPWGYDYLDLYAGNYAVDVPARVMEDSDFSSRVADENTIKLLKELGLLRDYSGGSLAAVGQANASDVDFLARLICAEAGSNKLDELLVGSVFMNRVASPRFPDTMLGVISQTGQYACYSDGNFERARPTQSEYDSARQILTGEFAIPKNIIFQSGDPRNGHIWFTNINSATGSSYENTHYYAWPADEPLDNVDRFGRTALSAGEAVALAKELSVSGSAMPDLPDGETPMEILSSMTYNGHKLYATFDFDVLLATNMLHNVVEPTQDGLLGLLQGILGSIGDFFTDFFSAIGDIFPDWSVYDGERVSYFISVPEEDRRRIIYQAVTFRDSLPYSDVEAEWELKDREFLFIGSKTYTYNFIPVISTSGSILKDWVSPTERAYSTTATNAGSSGMGAVLSIPEGTVIQALCSGRVTSASGNTVRIEYESVNGVKYASTYTGLSELDVTIGTRVSAGDTVGRSGMYNGKAGILFEFQNMISGNYEAPMQFFYQVVYDGAGSDVVGVALMEYENYKRNILTFPKKKYQTFVTGMTGGPLNNWCAYFVSWCGQQVYQSPNWPKDGSTSSILSKAKQDGVFHPANDMGYTPMPGDIVIFDWDGASSAARSPSSGYVTLGRGHVGLVIGVENGKLITVEGNTKCPDPSMYNYPNSTGIWRKTRAIDNNVVGFGNFSSRCGA